MDGSLDQLMRLLSNRGLEWLRQRIMALPEAMPVDHPDLGALALVGQAAPVLSGLRGRISPIEVIVARRLTPALVRAGAIRVLEGSRDPALAQLMLAGGLVACADPLWQMACEALAEDAALPLPQRLALCDDPALLAQAERLLTTPPTRITPEHVATVSQLLMQLYHHGARRPRLSQARAFTQIFDHLRGLADWAQGAGCTASVAQLAFCLRLVDADYPLAEMVSDLIQAQRPDGSFPARLGFGTADQTLAEAAGPTVMVAMALHMAAWRRWRGAAPIWLQPHPLRAAARLLAERLAAAPIPEPLALQAAASLTRATGRDWLARLQAPQGADPAQQAALARICFRDPVSARHVRRWLDLPRLSGAATTLEGVEAAWLSGAPVALSGPMPPALMLLWRRAAQAGDDAGFMACARMALHHADGVPCAAIRAHARRLAAQALTDIGPPEQDLVRLDRLILLAQLLEPEPAAAAAA